MCPVVPNSNVHRNRLGSPKMQAALQSFWVGLSVSISDKRPGGAQAGGVRITSRWECKVARTYFCAHSKGTELECPILAILESIPRGHVFHNVNRLSSPSPLLVLTLFSLTVLSLHIPVVLNTCLASPFVFEDGSHFLLVNIDR